MLKKDKKLFEEMVKNKDTFKLISDIFENLQKYPFNELLAKISLNLKDLNSPEKLKEYKKIFNLYSSAFTEKYKGKKNLQKLNPLFNSFAYQKDVNKKQKCSCKNPTSDLNIKNPINILKKQDFIGRFKFKIKLKEDNHIEKNYFFTMEEIEQINNAINFQLKAYNLNLDKLSNNFLFEIDFNKNKICINGENLNAFKKELNTILKLKGKVKGN